MRHCPDCGFSFSDEVSDCPDCGVKLSVSSATSRSDHVAASTKPTSVDMLISIFFPLFGMIFGILALTRREKKRGLQMVWISLSSLTVCILMMRLHG